MTGDTLARLLTALRSPDAYPYSVDRVESIETHISHVLLAGDHAFKLKKPLDLGFLDYSTLERRHAMCREEVRRNALLAPGIYDRVVAITGSPETPVLHDDPPPEGAHVLEYAVRMHRFPQDAQLDRRLAAERLAVADMDRVAECVAAYQSAAPRADDASSFGSPENVWRPIAENFAQTLERVDDRTLRARLSALQQRVETEHARLTPFLESRRRNGFVRACHGDLHLSNLADVDGAIVAFDCIEFDPNLAWIDVVSDTAFLVMDLLARGRRDLAATFLDAWLQRTGDFDGLRLLRHHLAYRSMVRAKVAAIAMTQSTDDARERAWEKLLLHVDLAERVSTPATGGLIVLCGLAGSGKSTIARALVREKAALTVHSDVERKRLFGLAAHESSHSPLDDGIYTPEAHRRTYEQVEQAVRGIVASGHIAVADACFLRRSERDHFRAVAGDLGVPCALVYLEVPQDTLLRRILDRQAAGTDASEAGPDVLARQIATAELPPAPDEPHLTLPIAVDAAPGDGDAADVLRLLAAEIVGFLLDPPG